MDKSDRKLVKKFTQFLKQSSKNTNSKSQRLAKTMRKYIQEELGQTVDTFGNPIHDSSMSKIKNKKHLSQYEMDVYYKMNLIKDMHSDHHKSKKEIRQMLHPTIEHEQLLPEGAEVQLTAPHSMLNSLFSNSKTKIKTKPMFYNRNKEFAKLPPTNLDVPVIRNASPYIGEEELIRKEYIKNKKKWVVPSQFKNFFGKASSLADKERYIPNYVTITPSEPPILHKFRDMDRGKWVDKSNFKV